MKRKGLSYMPVKQSHHISGTSVVATLIPVMTAVLVGFIIIGVALPVLPLHVKNGLGFGTFIVGLVAGAQFAASLISEYGPGAIQTSAVLKGRGRRTHRRCCVRVVIPGFSGW
jgi:hypothetical protein